MKPRAILGIGVDIAKVSRIQALVNKGPRYHQRFLQLICHPSEIEEYERKEAEQVKLQYLASRFALKEAMVKAAGRTDLEFAGIYLKKHNNMKTRPELTVDGAKNLQIFGELQVCSMHGSVSHEEDYAIAFVTLEKEL